LRELDPDGMTVKEYGCGPRMTPLHFPSASILPTLGSSRWGRTYDRGLTLVEASIDLMGIGTEERARQ
jgi:hypothetical protein